jgi:hypothetical protein
LSVTTTIPADVINYAIADGVTSISIDELAVTTNGLTPTGSPSSSVNPNSLTTSATDLPVTFTPEENTPYTYSTTYNPETWVTASNPGGVYFTPGDIETTFTYVIGNSPITESAACTPPNGVDALDSTVVNAPSPTPSYQVPVSVPPLQPQVSASVDGGWGVTFTNTSTVAVDGLSAVVSASDGGAPISFDLTGMSAAGTSCTSSGSGQVTCNVGTLASGDSETVNALVETTGLQQGTSITGSVNISSSNAGSESSSLGALQVVVITNGVEYVAVPNVAVSSTTKPLSHKRGSAVTLQLPKKVPAMVPSAALMAKLGMPLGSGNVKGPPVSVQLQSLAASSDAELCPPNSGGCEGSIVQIEGDFSAYTSTKKPISAVVEIFYGSTVPAGTMYFQDAPSDTPIALPACVKTNKEYNTPCVDGHEQIVGSSSKKSTEDTIFFTGGDPLVGRR